MQKLKIFPLILIICLALCSLAPAAYALDEPSVEAAAVFLAEFDSGEVLYEKNADAQRAPASLTKIMTGLLAIEALENGQCGMDDIVTAGADCQQGLEEDSSNSGIQSGEQMTFRDLLYCAIVHSANDACNVIATYVAGSISAFVDLMNQRAAELGCTNTHFANVNGLPADGHYTTARDLYIITKEAMSHPDFVTICNTVTYTVPATNVNDAREIWNSNALITDGGYYATVTQQKAGHSYLYEGASGVKTGYTRAAGYCLISTAERNGINVIAVVLGCSGELNSDSLEFGNFADTVTLYDWVFDNFSYKTLLSSAQFSREVTVDLAADGGSVLLRPEEDLTALMPSDVDDSSISTDVTIYDELLVAPIAAGTELGEVSVTVNGEEAGIVKLINPNAVELSKGEYIKQQLKAFFSKGWVIAIIIVVLALAALYLILVARYRRMRRRHIQERRRIEAERRRAREESRHQSAPIEYDEFYDGQGLPDDDTGERHTDPSDLDELFSRYDKY